jgi:hypothetical protein
MKPLLFALAFLITAPLARGADVASATFYIQLVRGTDVEARPAPQAHAIGGRLDQRLHDIFKWKNYWEVKRETVSLHSGMKVRKRMSAQREVEIAWSGPRAMEISLYTDGKLTRKRQQTIDTNFYISGGDRDAADCWFIIVRKDNPDSGSGQGMGTKLAETP